MGMAVFLYRTYEHAGKVDLTYESVLDFDRLFQNITFFTESEYIMKKKICDFLNLLHEKWPELPLFPLEKYVPPEYAPNFDQKQKWIISTMIMLLMIIALWLQQR